MGEPANIASALVRMARQQPASLAIAAPRRGKPRGPDFDVTWTYEELNRESDRIAQGFQDIGIGMGTRTALMVRPGLDLFAITFALFKVGAVPVLIDPGIGLKNLKVCLGEAEPEAFVGITAAHVARILLGWGRGTVRKLVTVGPRLMWGGHTLRGLKARVGTEDGAWEMARTGPEDMAAILFTSGSTGAPKGVVYTHGNFLAQVEAIRDVYGIHPGEVDLPTFPLFGLFDPALGMSTIIPDMDPTRPANVDPVKLLDAVRAYGVTNMFGSPALLNTVGRYAEQRGVKVQTLRRVISAGAPVTPPVMERILGMLPPGGDIVTPYGATESLPVSSIAASEVLSSCRERTEAGAGVCVGEPLDGVHVRVVEVDDREIPDWEGLRDVPDGTIGEVVVESAMTTSVYYNRPESTRLAKVGTKTGGVAHRMGDLGFMDEAGRLWFCGRKAQRVETASGRLHTVPCELVFNNHPSVYRSALVGVGPTGSATPVICVELEKDATIAKGELLTDLRALAEEREHTSTIRHFLVHPGFPVDIRHNAKIRRGELASWAAARVAL